MEHDLTQGNIFKNLIKLSWPGAVGRLFENLYDVVDMFWVGTLGGVLATQAQAGIVLFGVANSILQMFNSVFGPGSVTIISRYWGARDYPKAIWASEQTILYKFLVGCLGSALGLLFLPYMLAFAGASSVAPPGCQFSVMDMGLAYGRVILVAIPFIFVYYTVNTIFRCTSDPESSMFIIATSAILNIIIDPMFILGFGPIPKLGIAGAAIATFIAYLYADGLAMYLLFTGKKMHMVRYSLLAFPRIEGDTIRYRLRIPYFKLRLDKGGLKISFRGLLKPDKDILVSFVRIGVTPTVSQFFGSSSYYIFMNLVSRYGSAVVTAFGIGGRVSGIVNLPLLGINQAAAALVGQNLGAGKPERAEKTAWYSAIIGTCLGSLMIVGAFFFTKQIFGIFNGDPAVIAVGVMGFTYAMIGNTINAVSWMLSSVFDGSGYTMWPSIMGQVNAWLFNVLPIYLAVVVFDAGYVWVFYIGIFTASIQLLTTFYFVRAGAWKRARV